MKHSPEYVARFQQPSWFALRVEKIESLGGAARCEECDSREPPLQLHHLHYETLGRERLCDVRMLCKPCHDVADEQRRAG